jgi:isoleucyl-tRNA synthetase
MSKSLGNIIEIKAAAKDPGAEIVRLWVAATDYANDPPIDKNILARVVDSYRRIRNTLRFLLANVSDFDSAQAVPREQMLEIDRWALSRTAELQAELLAHYERFEFHPVVAKMQLFCSEDLGAFYLDVLKDRLYTTAPKSLARRSAQTALWHITHAMLRWMAPFLSFTAEEAWPIFSGGKDSIFTQTWWKLDAPDTELLLKWENIRNFRRVVTRAIEDKREAGLIGSSLMAGLTVYASHSMHRYLESIADDLHFVLIVSRAEVRPWDADAVQRHIEADQGRGAGNRFGSEPVGFAYAVVELLQNDVPNQKCERCWHWRDDVGHDVSHPGLCGRCTSNLYGAGEQRKVA